jgi:glycosyltransferase involved in cell wall biosynthesis
VVPDEFDLVIAHKVDHLGMVDAWKRDGYLDPETPVIFIFHYQPFDQAIVHKMRELVSDCHIVFNSYESQASWGVPNPSQRTIIHGFDINEWEEWRGGVSGILTVAGKMGQRRFATGYTLWYNTIKRIKNYDCMVMGSAWENPENWEREIIRHSEGWGDLKRTMATWDVYFSPTDESPFPRARSEAFVTGMPMVSTRKHNANLYIEDGISGFLINDADEAEDRLRQLLGDADLRKRFSRNAREKARQVLSSERYLKEWNDLLDFVMGY